MLHRHHHGHHKYRQYLTYLYLRLSISELLRGNAKNSIMVATLSKDCIVMDAQVSIGHVINAQLTFLDQNGNPMLVDPKPDSAPVWSNLNSAVETLVASADGLQAVITPLTAGVDTVTANVVVAGLKFQATLNVAVTPAAQVLTSVVITPTVV